MLSRLLYRGVSALGLPPLARRLINGALILCYHNVVDETDAATPRSPEASLHLPLAAFQRQMRWLKKHYHIVSLGEITRLLEQRRPLRGVASITFDDAYLGFFQYALPVLQDLEIAATVFVVANAPTSGEPFWWDHPAVQAAAGSTRRHSWLTDHRGDGDSILQSLASPQTTMVPRFQRPADWDTITRAVHEHLTIGVHTRTHRTLDTLGDEELRDELVTSREMIAGKTGTMPEFLSYPYGAWNPRVREAARSAGYRAAVTLDYGLNETGRDPLSLRRVNVPAGITDAAYAAWTAGLRLRPPVG